MASATLAIVLRTPSFSSRGSSYNGTALPAAYVKSSSLIPSKNSISCSALKPADTEIIRSLATCRQLTLTLLVGVAALTSKVSPVDAAYGEAANVFRTLKKNTDFITYNGEGFTLKIPLKWNPSKEKEYPGQVLRYEDNSEALNNVSVMVIPTDKKSIKDIGPPEEFTQFLGVGDHLHRYHKVELIRTLSENMELGNRIVDGGNEWYDNTERRAKQAAEKGLLYLGMGISGGEEGARNGPSLMPGGTLEAYRSGMDISDLSSPRQQIGGMMHRLSRGEADLKLQSAESFNKRLDLEDSLQSENFLISRDSRSGRPGTQQKPNPQVKKNHFQLFIKTPEGKTCLLWVHSGSTIMQLKQKIWPLNGYPVQLQHLIKGRWSLQDSRTLGSYEISTEETIVLNFRLRGGAMHQGQTSFSGGEKGQKATPQHQSKGFSSLQKHSSRQQRFRVFSRTRQIYTQAIYSRSARGNSSP